MNLFRFGIDLGGTTAKIGLVRSNKIVWHDSIPSNGKREPGHLLNDIAARAIPVIRQHRISRIGVGVAGDVDSTRGIVRQSPNLGWKNIPLKALLKRKLHCDVIVDNDANVATWGLFNEQAPRSVQNMIGITLGTGVGGGIIINRQLYRGQTGSAGEVGHMVMDPKGPLCNCGQHGCLETYAGGFYMLRTAIDLIKKRKKTILTRLVNGNIAELKMHHISRAATLGDKLSRTIFERAGHTLGRAIGDLIYILNPELVFLSGGVSQAGNLLLVPIKSELKKRPFKTAIQAAPVIIAKEAPHTGILGAALL